ncbi:hypothetical protein U1P98_04575 [Lysinibacillus irui]|uniref:Lipoprotein n=1 Tax=Lysinibacillus irui TaxID=2998077 RepID=A0ABU5NHP2_9BACI|nr:hypothetical protein [Lysinibacillus irui]MEA0552985.1 hypothetical protein [Lysinibacillus irui]MEA0975565.1 hypothetical protein [Lysinibacillus irui]MEA1041719.1 hypothetical protein [Lysinibacillus irui]
MKKLILSASLILTLILTGCGESDSSKPKETVKKVSLEEQSKQFIDENLEGKTIADFTNKLLTVKDEKLMEMIILGHKNGQQFKDDFDILGRKATASGVITEFVFESSNIGQKRRREGSTTAVRADKFILYMGSKDIENYKFIDYDELYDKDKNKEDFFLGVYPEEITNFAIVDLEQVAELSVGQKITVEGTIANYVLRKDFSDESQVEEFSVLINDAVLK